MASTRMKLAEKQADVAAPKGESAGKQVGQDCANSPPRVSRLDTMNLAQPVQTNQVPGFCIIPLGAGKPPLALHLSERRF